MRAIYMFMLIVLALGINCAPPLRPPVLLRIVDPPRTPIEQQRSVALIETVCWGGDPWSDGRYGLRLFTGSGVVVDDKHIVTADHVINCGVDDPVIHVVLSNGKRWKVDISAQDADRDVALLQFAGSGTFGLELPAPVVSAPLIGDPVCTAVAFPVRGGHCGYIIPSGNPNVLAYSALTEHGNSGGPLYSDGRLVGIVTALRGTTSGLASPTASHREWFSK